MIYISYPDTKLKDVSRQGQAKLKELTEEYIQDVIDEARHIETMRVNSENPEITADIVYDASRSVRKYGPHKKKSFGFLSLQIVFFIVCSIIGLFGFTDFSTPIKVVAYVAILILGVLLQVIIWLKE